MIDFYYAVTKELVLTILLLISDAISQILFSFLFFGWWIIRNMRFCGYCGSYIIWWCVVIQTWITMKFKEIHRRLGDTLWWLKLTMSRVQLYVILIFTHFFQSLFPPLTSPSLFSTVHTHSPHTPGSRSTWAAPETHTEPFWSAGSDSQESTKQTKIKSTERAVRYQWKCRKKRHNRAQF